MHREPLEVDTEIDVPFSLGPEPNSRTCGRNHRNREVRAARIQLQT
jgi:hypothetical protein